MGYGDRDSGESQRSGSRGGSRGRSSGGGPRRSFGNRDGGDGGRSFSGNRGGGRSFGGNRGGRPSGPREMHKAVCAKCQKECEVPFKPSGERPVYCRDCFQKQ